jgi:hypothetical protein
MVGWFWNDDLERVRKEAAMVLSSNMLQGTKDNHKNPQLGRTVSRPDIRMKQILISVLFCI